MLGGATSIWHWLIVLAIVLILFGGRGKISKIMGDVGKGIRSFKSGIKGDEDSQEDEEEAGAKPKPALKSTTSESGAGEKVAPQEGSAAKG